MAAGGVSIEWMWGDTPIEALARRNPLRKSSGTPMQVLQHLQEMSNQRPMLLRFGGTDDWERFGTRQEALDWLQRLIQRRQQISRILQERNPGGGAGEAEAFLREWAGREEEGLARLMHHHSLESEQAGGTGQCPNDDSRGSLDGYGAHSLRQAVTEADEASPQLRTAHCSWCLAETRHPLRSKSTFGRDSYKCSSCKKLTVPCKTCPAMAKETAAWASTSCVVCEGLLAGWPRLATAAASAPNAAAAAAATHSAVEALRAAGSMSGGGGAGATLMRTATISQTNSGVAEPVDDYMRQMLPLPTLCALQRQLLEVGARSALVRLDNLSPYTLVLLGQVSEQGQWAVPPPPKIDPNQEALFASFNAGSVLGTDTTAARVQYTAQLPDGTQVACIQLRWVIAGGNGDAARNRNWVETRTDFRAEAGPELTRVGPSPHDHADVGFILRAIRGASPDHHNPNSQSGQVLQEVAVGDVDGSAAVAKQATAEAAMRVSEGVADFLDLSECPGVFVWENQRRWPPIKRKFGADALLPIDPGNFSDTWFTHKYKGGLDDSWLLPKDAVWAPRSQWEAEPWQHAVNFGHLLATVGSWTAECHATDFVRRRRWHRACQPRADMHAKMLQQMRPTLHSNREVKLFLITVVNNSPYPLQLLSTGHTSGTYALFSGIGEPRSAIEPGGGRATFISEATALSAAIEGCIEFVCQPVVALEGGAAAAQGTDMARSYSSPKKRITTPTRGSAVKLRWVSEEGSLRDYLETRTQGKPQLMVMRHGPAPMQEGAATIAAQFVVETDPDPARDGVVRHFNPQEGIDDADCAVASSLVELREQALGTAQALRAKLTSHARSTLVTLINTSGYELVLERSQLDAGTWVRSPEKTIAPNSIVCIGVCSGKIPSGAECEVHYTTRPDSGEARQAGFRLKFSNPLVTSRRGRWCEKWLTGDDTLGLMVQRNSNSREEQHSNNEWKFVITSNEDPQLIYRTRKLELLSRMQDSEVGTVIGIANRCSAPLLLRHTRGKKVVACAKGKWTLHPPRKINPNETVVFGINALSGLTESGDCACEVTYDLTASTAANGIVHTATLSLHNPRGAGAPEYSEFSTGDVISQRLFDPLDVDRTAEEQKKACVCWVVEEAVTTQVQVGSSHGPEKRVHVAGVISAENTAVNADRQAKERFEVTIEDDDHIVVTRVDSPSGWSTDLALRCAIEGSQRQLSSPRSSSANDSFVAIGESHWLRRGRSFVKDKETEELVDLIKEELGIDTILRADVALEQACEKMLMPYDKGIAAKKLAQAVVDKLIEKVRHEEECGMFLSHFQANGAPQVRRMAIQLKEMSPSLQGEDRAGNSKIWLDVDQLPSESEMQRGVKNKSCFLLFLTKGVLTRPFCQKEVRWALRYRKRLVLVYDTNPEFGHSSFGDYIDECPIDLRIIFVENVAIPYYEDTEFGRISRCQILEAACMDVPPESLAYQSPRPLPTDLQATSLLFNKDDAVAFNQARLARQYILDAIPSLSEDRVQLFGGEQPFSHWQTPILLCFLTDQVFSFEPAVEALHKAWHQGAHIVWVAEADSRFRGVGTPVFGASMDERLIAQAPLSLQPMLRHTTVQPIPLYSMKLFREVSLRKILDAMALCPATSSADLACLSDGRGDAAELTEVGQLQQRVHELTSINAQLQAAVAEKDARIVALEARLAHCAQNPPPSDPVKY